MCVCVSVCVEQSRESLRPVMHNDEVFGNPYSESYRKSLQKRAARQKLKDWTGEIRQNDNPPKRFSSHAGPRQWIPIVLPQTLPLWCFWIAILAIVMQGRSSCLGQICANMTIAHSERSLNVSNRKKHILWLVFASADGREISRTCAWSAKEKKLLLLGFFVQKTQICFGYFSGPVVFCTPKNHFTKWP